jgi:hypothetical protein
MCGGGKGVQQTSQQVAYPSLPAASAYTTAMDRIAQATSQPFQKYSSDPNAYVAPLTSTQTGAIQNVTGLQGMTDPYYRTAGAMTLAGAAPVSRLSSGQIQEYMNPYMSQVVDPVQNALRQQFGMQQTQQQAQAIKSGAFGGERAGVERALLRGQQGLALGQALSPLYQTGYGQALQTAQGQQGIEAANLQRMLGAGAQVGGLGTAAQDAALKQASAQLQAGTLEQQTQTAQNQALYNEFQKQRMYPLQVAQMYAQAAGSLGPLMGSTSQGYQQMPFFGGFAADGGAIHGYDEGLGAARMGGAVEEAGDYARGGYAHGGIGAHLQYTDMSDPNASEKRKMDNLLASQQASLMAGLDTSGTEFPTGEIRPGRLLEASGLPERRQGIVERGLKAAVSDPSGTYEKAKGLGSGLKTGYKFLSEGPGALMGFAEGGDVHNNAMQDLLSNPIQVSKPQQPHQAPQEQKSGLLGGLLKAGAGMAANYFLPGSGALVSGALGAAGMADGGRAGYQEGGPSEDDFFKKGIQGAESAHRQFDKYGRTLTSPKGAEGISQIMPGTGPEAAKLAGLPYDRQRLRTDEEYNTALGNAYYNKQLKDFGTEELAAAAYNAGPGRVRQALARAEREGGDVMSYLPAETRNYVPTVMRKAGLSQDAIGENIAGLSPRDRSMMALYPEAKSAPSGVVPGERGIGSGQVTDKGFLERVEEKPERLIVPILQGLGAMAGSKNRYALGAIAEGLGAGAGSYMDMQQKEADILKRRQEAATEAEETRGKAASVGQTEAMTGLLGAETGEKILNIAGGAFKQVGPDWFVLNDKGQWVHLEKWRQEGGPLVGGAAAAAAANNLSSTLGVRPSAGAPLPGTESVTGETPAQTAAPRATQPPPMPPTTPVELTPGIVWNPDAEKLAKNEFGKFSGPGKEAMQRKSDQYVDQTTNGSDAAFATRPMHADVARIIAEAAKQKGLNAPGVGFGATSVIVGSLNRIANAAGIPGDVFGKARTQRDLNDKLSGISARLATTEAGQKAYGALQSTIQTMPDLEKTPAAAAENAADNIMNNQRAVDRLAHMRKYGSISNNRFTDADTAFNTSNSASKYNKERDALRDLIIGKVPTPEGTRSDVADAHKILDKMYDPNTPPEAIDKFFKDHYGLDNMSRYFR